MQICVITPAGLPRRAGNQTTADRWCALLRRLGHRTQLRQRYTGQGCDLMIALHAWRSAPSIDDFRSRHPRKPLIVALTGTDLYRFLHSHPAITGRSLAHASRLVGLHDRVIRALPAAHHAKLRVVIQSALACPPAPPDPDHFDVCVIGHLRDVKDPLRTALAVRDLPATSRIRVTHLGEAHEARWAERARAEASRNPRYRWRGGVSGAEVRRVLATARLLVLSSRAEGGANVISEAVAAGVPVLASHIEGSRGLLGEDHPGYFPVGDTDALRALLLAVESDPARRDALEIHRARLAPRFDPAREQRAWHDLLEEFETPGARDR